MISAEQQISERLDRIEAALQSLTERMAAGTTPPKDVMNTKEVAQYIGLSVSRIRHLTSKRGIPFFKRTDGARENYFRREEIDSWLAGTRISTRSELETIAATHCALRPIQSSRRGGHRRAARP